MENEDNLIDFDFEDLNAENEDIDGQQSEDLSVPIPEHWEVVSTALNTMRSSTILTDVVLLCKGVEFPAHRALLAASSPYFYTMFSCGLRETIEFSVDMPGVEPGGLDAVLESLYTGMMKPVKEDELFAVVEAAHLMQFQHMFAHYRDRMLRTLSQSTFVTIWDTADRLNDDGVRDALFRFALHNIDTFHNSEELRSLSYERLFELLNRLCEKGPASADDMFALVSGWVCHDKTLRMEQLSNLLPFISFESLSPALLSVLVKECPIPECPVVVQKVASAASERLHLMSRFKGLWDRKNSIVLTGVASNGQLSIHKFRSWSWTKIFLRLSVAEVMVAIRYRGNFYFFAREAGEYMMDVFDEDGQRRRRSRGFSASDVTVDEQSLLAVAADEEGISVLEYFIGKSKCSLYEHCHGTSGRTDVYHREKMKFSRGWSPRGIIRLIRLEERVFAFATTSCEATVDALESASSSVANSDHLRLVCFCKHGKDFSLRGSLDLPELRAGAADNPMELFFCTLVADAKKVYVLPKRVNVTYVYDIPHMSWTVVSIPSLQNDIVSVTSLKDFLIVVDTDGQLLLNHSNSLDNWSLLTKTPELPDRFPHLLI